MATQPEYLVIMAINNLLLKRISGGPKNQMNQSNNNIKIRSGANEMINYLHQTGKFHLAFFTSMYVNNAVICLKKLLDGKKTGISINKNIECNYFIIIDKAKKENVKPTKFTVTKEEIKDLGSTLKTMITNPIDLNPVSKT
jgi:hypothetical protein